MKSYNRYWYCHDQKFSISKHRKNSEKENPANGIRQEMIPIRKSAIVACSQELLAIYVILEFPNFGDISGAKKNPPIGGRRHVITRQ
jgi:hypothetical protein